jgi:hypothetical protein
VEVQSIAINLQRMIGAGRDRPLEPGQINDLATPLTTTVSRPPTQHRSITCEVCDTSPLIGIRYKGTHNDEDYDICEKVQGRVQLEVERGFYDTIAQTVLAYCEAVWPRARLWRL